MNNYLWKVKWHKSYYDTNLHRQVDCGVFKGYVVTSDLSLFSVVDKLKSLEPNLSVKIDIIKACYLGNVHK